MRVDVGSPQMESNGPLLVPTRNTSRTSSASMPRYTRDYCTF